MSNYKEYKEKVLLNPKVKSEYDALKPEYDLIQEMFDARKNESIVIADICRIENDIKK